MLPRIALAGLLLANGAYFLWAHGDLVGFGLAPSSIYEREPQRMTRQVRPEWLQLRKDAKPSP